MRPFVALAVLAVVSAPWVVGCQAVLGIHDPEAPDAEPDPAPSSTVDPTRDGSSGAMVDPGGATVLDGASAVDSSVADAAEEATEQASIREASAEAGGEDAADAAGKADVAAVDAGAPTLYGATVSLSIHCCTAPPDSTNLASTYPSAVVGPQVEFPSIGRSEVLPATLDVKPSSIEIGIPAAATSSSGGFNGYVLVFSPTPPATPEIPSILAATLDKASTAPLTNIAVTFANSADGTRTVEINVAGTAAPANSDIIVDLVLGAPDAG